MIKDNNFIFLRVKFLQYWEPVPQYNYTGGHLASLISKVGLLVSLFVAFYTTLIFLSEKSRVPGFSQHMVCSLNRLRKMDRILIENSQMQKINAYIDSVSLQ